jgi:hypothetical protein
VKSTDQQVEHVASPSGRGEGGRWLRGVSGNPRGRPRTGLSFIEAVRKTVDPARVIARVQGILDDPRSKPRDVLQAAEFLRAAGYVRPADRLEVSRGEPDPDVAAESQRILRGLDVDEMRQLRDLLERGDRRAERALELPAGAANDYLAPGGLPGGVIDIPEESPMLAPTVKNEGFLQSSDSEELAEPEPSDPGDLAGGEPDNPTTTDWKAVARRLLEIHRARGSR